MDPLDLFVVFVLAVVADALFLWRLRYTKPSTRSSNREN